VSANVRDDAPLVSVIIPTYNWSSVLRYAIESVRQQTYPNWELWVVGDGCTDDSEAVVRAFQDPRIHWDNLPHNMGSQFAANNRGIALAQGACITYLGHDDIWHPTHLDVLMAAMRDTGADFVFSLLKLFRPDKPIQHTVTGLTVSGRYEPEMILPPGSFLHTKQLALDIGGWRDHRVLFHSTDVDFALRVWAHGARMVCAPELTVFKLSATSQPNAYTEKPSHVQAQYLDGVTHDASFRYRELLSVLLERAHIAQAFTLLTGRLLDLRRGTSTHLTRTQRGLAADAENAAVQTVSPLYTDAADLLALNDRDADIIAAEARTALWTCGALQADAVYLGEGWNSYEQAANAAGFRWAMPDAQLVLVRPAAGARRLLLDLAPGPGVASQPFTLRVIVEGASAALMEIGITGPGWAAVPLTVPHGCEGMLLRLYAVGGGQSIAGDPRIMDFAVFGLRWAEAELPLSQAAEVFARPARSTDEPLGALEAERAWLNERVRALEDERAARDAERNWLLEVKAQQAEQLDALDRERAWLYSVQAQQAQQIEQLQAQLEAALQQRGSPGRP
jgi:GT2 family glycosyltransferase